MVCREWRCQLKMHDTCGRYLQNFICLFLSFFANCFLTASNFILSLNVCVNETVVKRTYVFLSRNNFTRHLKCDSFMKQQSVVTHRHTVLQKTEKTRPILNRLTHTHDMCLPRYKESNFFFVGTTFWQKVCSYSSCLVMRESHFDELCGLRHTAVPWMLCYFCASVANIVT
jgi:hypothetical protein